MRKKQKIYVSALVDETSDISDRSIHYYFPIISQRLSSVYCVAIVISFGHYFEQDNVYGVYTLNISNYVIVFSQFTILIDMNWMIYEAYSSVYIEL